MRNAKTIVSVLTFSIALLAAFSSRADDSQAPSAEPSGKLSPQSCDPEGLYDSEGECDYAGAEWVHYQGATNYRCDYETKLQRWLLWVSYDYTC